MPVVVHDAAELSQLEGQVVQVVGLYAVEDLGRHKILYERPDGTTGSSSKIVRLGLDGDIWLELWVRPDDEMAAYDDKRVRVTGTYVSTPPSTGPAAAMDAGPSLLKITDLREAD
ncbi:MAG: hypothetical protein HS111_01470 [Kofleriaceae bacterium]|nr:hypothetical protein [Kofleriaceae bacterium]